MEPWYKVATPRAEVREGRSFNPDEFAIALEQVVAGTAPLDYRDAEKFFSRTYFTRALKEHSGMVLRRICGKTENTAPVLTLVTQFGGGKTHTLTALYHIVKNGTLAARNSGVADLMKHAEVEAIPQAQVGVFVGNAWDPKEGKETPWIDIAYQLAGKKGVETLGKKALTTPPGTETISELFKVAGGRVLILFDEVLNFINRHRDMADAFHSFIQNLTVAATGTTHCAVVISLPRSQVEMTTKDMEWQEKITKVVRRVAKDLIANDEGEISEVIRRRLFEDIGKEHVIKSVAKEYANWCFERRAQLPPEWTAVDSSATEVKAKDFLRKRFENCYPFHPATLSVFQRKWAAIPQYQQTRGTLAMLAQWISWVYRDNFINARKESLITLGSAPLHISQFQATVIGQLGEARLVPAIEADIVGQLSHAIALDVDSKGPLKNIHQRVGTTIFFESSGGMREKVAHLPELRFALGEPNLDTTTIDSTASALETRSFYLHRYGTDGFRFGYKPTLKKVVSDRRASLDESEIKSRLRSFVKIEFEKAKKLPLFFSPEDSSSIQDSPWLTLVVMDPDIEWTEKNGIQKQLSEWTRERGNSPRTYPASLVWCIRKPGRELRDRVEMYMAWKKVSDEITNGTIGGDFEPADKLRVRGNLTEAEESVRDEIWASYRFAFLLDPQSATGMKTIDLGAGHASASESICGRIITALKSEGLLNESVGAGYIERNWPTVLKESGSWSLLGLRQSFLNGSLTRLLDPDKVLKIKLTEFIERGDFGLGSNPQPDGTYSKIWWNEIISPDEISFDKDVFLLLKEKAKQFKTVISPVIQITTGTSAQQITLEPLKISGSEKEILAKKEIKTMKLSGHLAPEIWNRFGNKILPKVKSNQELKIGITISFSGNSEETTRLVLELKQAIADLGLSDQVRFENVE